MLSTKTLSGIILFLFASFTYAQAPFAYRNADIYDLSIPGFAVLTVITSPAQAHQPVFSWRQHYRAFGQGFAGYNGEYIGDTDHQGILQIVVPHSALNGDYCGHYANETFAVGSPSAPRSQALSFDIIQSIQFSPRDPNCSFIPDIH